MASNGKPEQRSGSGPLQEATWARCGGLLIVDHYIDLQDDTGQIGLTALRCMSCGEVIDAVILQNRVRPAPNLLYGTKRRKYAQRIDEGESDGSINMDDNASEAGHGS